MAYSSGKTAYDALLTRVFPASLDMSIGKD